MVLTWEAAQKQEICENSLDVWIRNNPGASTRAFDGIINEVRISSDARSESWCETEFNNIDDYDNFITITSGGGNPTWGADSGPHDSGAKDFDEPEVYITLSQNTEEIKHDSKSFGWDLDDLITNDKIMMVDARPFKIQDELIGKDDSFLRGEQIPFQHLTRLILSSIKRIDAKRLVIDSIIILSMQYSDKFYLRQDLQGLIQSLENFGVTTMVLSEFNEK